MRAPLKTFMQPGRISHMPGQLGDWRQTASIAVLDAAKCISPAWAALQCGCVYFQSLLDRPARVGKGYISRSGHFRARLCMRNEIVEVQGV